MHTQISCNLIDLAIFITAISALLTAIINIGMLIESNKQRVSAYRPQLVLKEEEFFLSLRNNLPLIWSHEELAPGQILKTEGFINLNLFNIGLGAAKELQVDWEFPLKKILRDIKEHPFKSSINIDYSCDYFLSVKVSDRESWAVNFTSHSSRFDYLLPANTNNQSLKIKFPRDYLILLSILFYLDSKDFENSENKEAYNFIPFPKFCLKLRYRDIGNKEHQLDFFVEIRPHIIESLKSKKDFESVLKGTFTITNC